jgi:integrase/recombinase XerC
MTRPGRVQTGITSALARMPAVLRDDVKAWSWSLESEDKSPNTILGYLTALLKFAESLPAEVTTPAEITHRHVQAFLASLRKADSTNSTAVTRYIALGVFFKWAVRDRVIEVNPMDRVDRPASRKPSTDIPDLGEIKALLATCNGGRTDFTTLRDRAIIRCMADCGFRRDEIGSLRVADVDLDTREVRVIGKGRKTRTNIISPRTRKALHDYLRVRAEHVYASSPMLWLGARGHPPIDSEAIWQIIDRRAKRAGVRIHPHMFRHYAADAYLAAGYPEGAVMQMMGWTDRRMLDRYGAANAERRALEAQREAALGDRL